MDANLEMLKGTGNDEYIYPYTVREAVVDRDGTSAFDNLKNELFKVIYTNNDSKDTVPEDLTVDLNTKEYLMYIIEYECIEGYNNGDTARTIMIPGSNDNGSKSQLVLAIGNCSDDSSSKYIESVDINITETNLSITRYNKSRSYVFNNDESSNNVKITKIDIDKSIMRINKIIGVFQV